MAMVVTPTESTSSGNKTGPQALSTAMGARYRSLEPVQVLRSAQPGAADHSVSGTTCRRSRPWRPARVRMSAEAVSQFNQA